MASSTKDKHKTSFKCRKCRLVLFNEDSVLLSQGAEDGGHLMSKAIASRYQQLGSDGALWFISDENRPSWIQAAVEEAQWTRGKLACPKCRGRIGSFDFLTPSIRHRQDCLGSWSCVQVIGSRVDCEMPESLLPTLRNGVQEQSLQGSSLAPLEEDSTYDIINSPPNEDGPLHRGCWYLNGLDSRPGKDGHSDVEPTCSKCGDVPTGRHCGMDDTRSLKPLVNKNSKTLTITPSQVHASSDIHTFNNSGSVKSVPVDESLSFTFIPSRGSCSTLSTEGNQVRHRAGHKHSERTTTRSSVSHANTDDEIFQSGSGTSMPNKSAIKNDGIEYGFVRPDKSVSGDVEHNPACNISGSLPLPAETTRHSSTSENVGLQQNSHHSSSTPQPNSDSESLLGQAQEAQRQAIDYSNLYDNESESDTVETRVEVGPSPSPLTWQDFLDELLSELERDTSEEGCPNSRAANGINQLEDELDSASQQEEDFNEEETSNAQGTSAHLERAILRAQKKEKNRRKSERRKLRRQEKWREGKVAENHDLLMEEQNLDCDSSKIMSLLGTCEAGMSLREATTCPICLDLYLYPNICLPCRHIFCEPCLRQLAQAVQSSMTPCPLCRTVIQEVKSHQKLTIAIQEAFPRMIALRKQNERKTLKKSFPLPGDAALNTPMSSWFKHMLRGRTRRHNTVGLHHSRLRGRQEVGMEWQIGAACILMTALVGLTGVFLFSMFM